MFRTRPLIAILYGLGAVLTLGAQAQVLRCTDAGTGQVTYTDGRCAGNASAHEVEPRKTAQEIQQERALAAQALAREQQRREVEASAAEAQAQRNAQEERQRQREQAAAPRPAEPARSPECARSRRLLEVLLAGSGGAQEQDLRIDAARQQVDLDCLGPETYARLEQARAVRSATAPVIVLLPPPPRRPAYPQAVPTPPPRRFTQCNVFRCYDSQGNIYPH